MAIGVNFEFITKLQYKVKALTARVQSFESGEKYAAMNADFEKRLAAKEREIKKLKSQLANARCETVTVGTVLKFRIES